MLDRVVSKDKEKVQFYLAPATIKVIFARAASFSPRKTQSKYITDLVERDVTVKSLDTEKLRATLRGLMSNEDAELSKEETEEIIDSYLPRILSIFGLESAW